MFSFLISNLIIASLAKSPKNTSTCPSIKLQTDPPLNITEYIKASWYIQQQQVTSYQPPESLYCVTATYNMDCHSKVPFFNGTVLSVYNYANAGMVNGPHTNNNTVLCARQKNVSEPEKLLVAPCFLPNLFGGPYWIVEAGPYQDRYEWAVVSGGQPTVRVSNTTCTTNEIGISNSGLWIFSRKTVLDSQTLHSIRMRMEMKNISTKNLLNVTHEGCNYTGAFLKF